MLYVNYISVNWKSFLSVKNSLCGVGGRIKRKGIYAYLWLIHSDVQQKLMQHCKIYSHKMIKLKNYQ